jgi:exopolysaccharide biosynthesis polyprenyl glycosylphosphotransferase
MQNTLPKKQLLLLGGDVILIIASFYLAPVLLFGIFLDVSLVFEWVDLSAILVYLLMFYVFDFYNLVDEQFTSIVFAMRALTAIIVADLFIVTLFYIFNVRPYATIILILNTLLIFSFCLEWRILCSWWGIRIQKVFRVLIIGAGGAGRSLYEMLHRRDDFEIKGFLDDNPIKLGDKLGLVRVLGETKLLPSLLEEIDIVVAAITRNISQDLYKQLVDAKMKGVAVYEMPTFCEKVLGKIPVQHVSDLWFVYAPISGVRRNLYNVKLKRIADMILSFLGLLLTLPITLFTALAIKFASKGPVFYIHQRTGLNGQKFDLIKFRTMEVGLESRRQHAGQKDDPRITKIGKFVRFFRIDEIPQMWNVIKGEMSFIGPRALIDAEVEEFSPQIPYFSLRHSIRPGITGWAQINYPHGATRDDALAKLEFDLYYIKNLSPLLDLIILARTIRTVLFGKGAR